MSKQQTSTTPAGIWGEVAPSSDILKFQSGVPVRLRLTGPAIKFKREDGTYRFASMAYVYGESCLRLWLFGWQTQTAIKGLYEMLGDPSKYDLAVVANGDGLQRSYSISGLPPTDGPPEPYTGTVADLQKAVLPLTKGSAKTPEPEKTPPKADEYDPFADD